MPFEYAKPLILFNLDSLAADPEPDEEVIITEGEFDVVAFEMAGFTRVVSVPNGAQTGEHGFAYLYKNGNSGELIDDLTKFSRYIIATDGDAKGMACRDALAVRLGDDKCRWIEYPALAEKPDGNQVLIECGHEVLSELVFSAKPMWTDEVCRLDDVPSPGDEIRYKTGIRDLDQHGYRITLPAFMAIMGPYGSGKSVLARQLMASLWREHQWPFLITSFEERIKPRYQRDFRRHFIGRQSTPDHPWTFLEITKADLEINEAAVFLRRKSGSLLDLDRLVDRIEYAIRVYGIKVVGIDPVNELDRRLERGELTTDYIGRFIRSLKALADDYNVLMMCVGHVSKDAAEKKLSKKGLLTLNDGEDSRHWGGKTDIGWVMWRDINGPSYLNVDKVKDHETMGRPELFELQLDRAMNTFSVTDKGYDEIFSKWLQQKVNRK